MTFWKNLRQWTTLRAYTVMPNQQRCCTVAWRQLKIRTLRTFSSWQKSCCVLLNLDIGHTNFNITSKSSRNWLFCDYKWQIVENSYCILYCKTVASFYGRPVSNIGNFRHEDVTDFAKSSNCNGDMPLKYWWQPIDERLSDYADKKQHIILREATDMWRSLTVSSWFTDTFELQR